MFKFFLFSPQKLKKTYLVDSKPCLILILIFSWADLMFQSEKGYVIVSHGDKVYLPLTIFIKQGFEYTKYFY